jgi:hypothetical protein
MHHKPLMMHELPRCSGGCVSRDCFRQFTSQRLSQNWTKAEASKKIEELQQKTERGKRRTATANGIANS